MSDKEYFDDKCDICGKEVRLSSYTDDEALGIKCWECSRTYCKACHNRTHWANRIGMIF